MKFKGTHEQHPMGKQHVETTRDDGIRVITLRENAQWSSGLIGTELGIDRRTC